MAGVLVSESRRPRGSEPVLEVRSLGLPGHGVDDALDDLSLEVRPGEVFSVADATTGAARFVEVCVGLVPPARGRVLINGLDAWRDSRVARRHLTAVAAWMSMPPALTPVQGAEYFARIAGVRITRREAERALRRMCVAERDFDRSLERLSADIQPLVWLAVAALRNVPCIVIDSPPWRGEASFALEEALAVSTEDGRAVLVTTSDPRLATALGDRVAILRDGRLTGIRARADLAGDALSAFYLEFLGGHSAVQPHSS